MHLLWLLAQDDGGAPFLLGGGMLLVALLIGLVARVLWIWALVDAIKNPGLSDNERIIWILAILLTNWLGALLDLIVGRKRGADT
jgi:hypothetical protein